MRVSTKEQADQGVSLEAQEAKIGVYAQLYELDVLRVITDAGVSAKSLERPGLAQALGMLRSGEAEALLVVKLDRLTRSVADLGRLVEEYFSPGGAALLSVGEQIDTRSAGGRLVLNVLASVSQWEREAIGERTSTAMQHMAANGEYTGGPVPYGYAVGPDGKLQEVAAEQQAVAAAKDLRRAGLSLRDVSAALAARGYRARTGRAFAPAQVLRMVAAE